MQVPSPDDIIVRPRAHRQAIHPSDVVGTFAGKVHLEVRAKTCRDTLITRELLNVKRDCKDCAHKIGKT